MKEEIGLQVIHYDHFVTAYTDVSKHIRFLLQQPGIQDALNFPNPSVYDYLDEFRYLN